MFGGFFKSNSEPAPPERPFQAVVPEQATSSDNGSFSEEMSAPSISDADAEWSVDDIESAYLRALEAAESVAELAIMDAGITDSFPEDDPDEAIIDDEPEADRELEFHHGSTPAEEQIVASEEESDEPESDDDRAPRVTPRQIIEALLFVGGRPLTSRQLADVLGGSTTQEYVDEEISLLNTTYNRQQRPYEIRLGDGGYRLNLQADYEKVRARVFGIGPREVKLPQNALELLALIAYQQPITREDVEASGLSGASGLLRQLLRRELIQLQRGSDGEPDVYRTTKRFLELFGLRSLNDLPRPEAINRR